MHWKWSNNSAYQKALLALSKEGTYVTIDAGNNAQNASYYVPAYINSNKIYTVASMICNQVFSSFSNYNIDPIDFMATDCSLFSTYLNSRYE